MAGYRNYLVTFQRKDKPDSERTLKVSAPTSLDAVRLVNAEFSKNKINITSVKVDKGNEVQTETGNN